MDLDKMLAATFEVVAGADRGVRFTVSGFDRSKDVIYLHYAGKRQRCILSVFLDALTAGGIEERATWRTR